MTKVKFVADPTEDIVVEDNDQSHTIVTIDLPDKWTGTTAFDDLPDEDMK